MLEPTFHPPPRQLVPDAVPVPGGDAQAKATDADGIHWACQRCTNCCRWPGEVRLLPDESAKIATFLGLTEDAFVAQYTQLREDRLGLCLTNEPDGACTMLAGRDCRIQGAKPYQCTGFPNTWRFPGWRDVCEAIPLQRGPTGEWQRVELP